MTTKQKVVLEAVRDLTDAEIGPTFREIADETRMGLQSVTNCIEQLIASGHVYRTSATRRNLRAVGHFDDRAIANLSHDELLALRSAIDARLCERRAA